MGEILEQRVAPLVLVDPGADMAVEVAIRTFADAERPMHIERQRRFCSRGVQFGLDSKAGHDARAPYGPCPADTSRSLGDPAARRSAVERPAAAGTQPAAAAIDHDRRPQP